MLAMTETRLAALEPLLPSGQQISAAGNGIIIQSSAGMPDLLEELASGRYFVYRVQPDEQGIVLRFGAYNRMTLPGLNYHLPWPIERVETPAVTRINRIEIGDRARAGDVLSALRRLRRGRPESRPSRLGRST